jgi:3-oxoacyl-[acyl-carrier protein] reductase
LRDFRGKVVVVTGAAGGLGRALCLRFGAAGSRIVALDRDAAALAVLLADLQGRGIAAATEVCDLSRDEECRRAIAGAIQAFGRIDVLINNAGGMLGRVKIEDYTVEHIQRVLALNCTQVALFMREVIPLMRQQKSGNVINVTSIAARHGGGGGAILYAGAKGFVSTVTHGWAKEVVGDGIRVNALSPGVITTPFHDRYSTAEQLKAMQAMIPMNRLGGADECTGTLLYLASDALSGYVTGQVVEVNGGQYMP